MYWHPHLSTCSAAVCSQYNSTVVLQRGGSVEVARRERPKVLVENGTATVLTNGVCLQTGDRQCFTMAQRILKG